MAHVQEEYATDQERWQAQLDVYKQQLHVEKHERMAALALAAEEQQKVQQKFWEVRFPEATFSHTCRSADASGSEVLRQACGNGAVLQLPCPLGRLAHMH